MAEKIDLEKCNFQNFRSPVTLTLTLDRVEVIRLRISGRGLPHTKLDRNRKKKLVDGRKYVRTYVRTDMTSNSKSIRTSPGDDLIKNAKHLVVTLMQSALVKIPYRLYYCATDVKHFIKYTTEIIWLI